MCFLRGYNPAKLVVSPDNFRALEAEFTLLKRQFLACDDPLEKQQLLQQVSLLVSKISEGAPAPS